MRIKIWILSKILDQRIYPLIKDDACDGVTTFESTFSNVFSSKSDQRHFKHTLHNAVGSKSILVGGGGGGGGGGSSSPPPPSSPASDGLVNTPALLIFKQDHRVALSFRNSYKSSISTIMTSKQMEVVHTVFKFS